MSKCADRQHAIHPAGMTDNTSQQEGVSLRRVSRQDQLDLYDGLPKRYRRTHDRYRRHLRFTAMRADMSLSLRLRFPGWSPPP